MRDSIFDPLFAKDRGVHRFVALEPDEQSYTIVAREAGEKAAAVLIRPSNEVRDRADVERAVAFGG